MEANYDSRNSEVKAGGWHLSYRVIRSWLEEKKKKKEKERRNK